MRESVQTRLQELEASNRALRRRMRVLEGCVVGLLVVAVAAPMLGTALGEDAAQPPPVNWEAVPTGEPPILDVLRARRVEVVVGTESKVALTLGATESGNGYMDALAADGRSLVRVGSEPEETIGAVSIVGEGGFQVFRAAQTGDGAEVTLAARGGQRLVRLGANDAGTGELALGNRQGFNVVTLGSNEAGEGSFRLSDESGHVLASLGTGATGQARFELRNEHGARFFDFTVDESRAGRMTIGDMQGAIVMTFPPPAAPVEPHEAPAPLPEGAPGAVGAPAATSAPHGSPGPAAAQPAVGGGSGQPAPAAP
ncbi:MAG TPA: hypothetical protein VEC57_08175 [Candidatus Limnocylindrales bacterium]|nr:hypothetical protein [Candidatus Limnocylindrales bacterium]